MNFNNVFDELNKLYESVEAKPAKDAKLTEAEEADIEVVDDEEVVTDAAEAQLVLECAKCGGLIIKAAADLDLTDTTKPVNMDEACQYCEAAEGYTIVGSLLPYGEAPAEEEADEEDAEDELAEEVVEKSVKDTEVDKDAELNELLDLAPSVTLNLDGGQGNDVDVL